MNTENHKLVSKSARVSDEKTPKCKAFAGMKLSSDNLIYFFTCSLNVFGYIIWCLGIFCKVDTAPAVFNNFKLKDEGKMKH